MKTRNRTIVRVLKCHPFTCVEQSAKIFLILSYFVFNRVSIVTGLRAGRQGFDSRKDAVFLFVTASRPDEGCPSILLPKGCQGSFVGSEVAGV